jgi:hypothetical protein
MKQKISLLILALLFCFQAPVRADDGEAWKGHTVTSPVELGVMTGMNLYGSDVNWSLLATGAYLLAEDGWADDVDDRIWAELELGPSFFSVLNDHSTGLQYSAHIRWDFTYNEYWTFYGLGGLGGYFLPDSLGGAFTIHPRFGVGVEYQTKTALMFRGELSHEFIGAGIALNF